MKFTPMFTATITSHITVDVSDAIRVRGEVEARVLALLRSRKVLDALAPVIGDYSVEVELGYIGTAQD